MSRELSFVFPADKLKGLLIFAPTGDIRKHLNGVCFHRQGKGMVGVATDGHRLTVIYHEPALTALGTPAPEGEFPPVTIPRQALELALKCVVKSRGMDPPPIIFTVTRPDVGERIVRGSPHEKPARVRIVSSGQTAEVDALDGRSLDWQRVVPFPIPQSGEVAVDHGFNADYLADYAKLCRALGKRYPTIRLIQRGDDSAYVDIGDDNVLSIVMPLRWKSEVSKHEWMHEPTGAPEPQQEAA